MFSVWSTEPESSSPTLLLKVHTQDITTEHMMSELSVSSNEPEGPVETEACL